MIEPIRGQALRIAVVTPLPVSGEEGGNERHWRSLTAALIDAGHDAELVGLVSPEADLSEVLDSYAMFHALDLSAFDVVVSGKYPSFMVHHPRHIRHLNHPLRGLYEHYPTGLPTDLPPDLRAGITACGDDVDQLIAWATERLAERAQDPVMAFPGPFARAVVQRLDRIGRDRLAAEAAVSETVANRLDYVDDQRAISIIAPLGDLEINAPLGDDPRPSSVTRPFLFTFGRLDRAKRFDLIINSFQMARRLPGMGNVELVVAGGGPLAEELATLANDRVRFVGRLPDDELTDHLRHATAVVLAPVDEDYGLVAAEAMAASTPVIATSDSGGIAEQIVHGRSGLVVHPKPALLANAMRSLAADPDRAASMGRAAADSVRSLSWQPMVDLVGATAESTTRPRIVMLSTFPGEPVTSGGQRRLRGMAAGLASHGWTPCILSLTNRVGPGQVRRRRTPDGVEHVMVGRSAAHLEADFAMASLLDTPIDDVAAASLWAATPLFGQELRNQLDTADMVMLSHPFLVRALADCGAAIPVVYDAYNVETDLKAELFDHREGGAWVADLAAETEAEALAIADVVSATSNPDLERFSTLGLLRSDARSVVAVNPLAADVIAPRTDDERLTARRRFLADVGRAGDDRPLALFVGSDHPPNRAAAQLCHDLAAQRPDLLVVIAGTVSTAGGAAVEIGSFLPHDLRRLHVMADLILNPVLEGSGTSLKLIDPLSLEVPVVTTRVGARGLESPDETVWIADPSASGSQTPDLAAAVDRVLNSGPDATRERLTRARSIAEQATPANAMRPLARTLDELASSANSSVRRPSRSIEE